jgi:indolepyruvate decarboxylase
MLAFDREVRVGHHVYPDVPIATDRALAARAPLSAGDARANRPAVDYPRGLKADDHPVAPPTLLPPSTTFSTATAPCR